jgi:hypothetical protein
MDLRKHVPPERTAFARPLSDEGARLPELILRCRSFKRDLASAAIALS